MPTGTTTKIRKNLPIYSYMAASTMLPIFIPSCPFQSNKMRRGPKHTHLSLVAFCYFHIPRPVRSHFYRTVIILYFTITVNGHIMFYDTKKRMNIHATKPTFMRPYLRF